MTASLYVQHMMREEETALRLYSFLLIKVPIELQSQ